MNPTQDLSTLGAGFSDLAIGSQAVFRAALDALSHPGRPIDVPHDAEAPTPGHAASAALLLALLDPDCVLWLSPTLAASHTAAWLRFHCGCTLADDPARAHFAWAASLDELPPLEAFAQGTDTDPDQSVTCVVDVPALAEGLDADGWVLSGPGIRGEAHLQVYGLAPAAAHRLLQARARSHAAFPRGVDLFLATSRQIVGLPRTTRIAPEA